MANLGKWYHNEVSAREVGFIIQQPSNLANADQLFMREIDQGENRVILEFGNLAEMLDDFWQLN